MTHELQIGKEYLRNLLDGRKKVEIRFNDNDYQLGDKLKFYDGEHSKYVEFQITHVHSDFGMVDGYVALSVIEVKP